MSIKYRDSATSAEWKDIQNTTVINKHYYIQDIWFDGTINRNNSGVEQSYVFDVSNWQSLSFTHDYNAPNTNSLCADVAATIYYGYALTDAKYEGSVYPQLAQVDGNAKAEALYDNLTTDIKAATVTFDVSNYSSIVIQFQTRFDTSKNTAGGTQYGYAHLYNIRASEE